MLLLWSCGNSSSDSKVKGQIGYRFYSSLDSVADSTSRRDEVSQGLIGQFQRLKNGSTVHAAWSDWPDVTVQMQLCKALEQHPKIRMHLIMDPSHAFYTSLLDASRSAIPLAHQNYMAGHGQVILENQANPNAGILNPQAKAGRMQANMLLFQNLRPQGPDDGAFSLFICDAALPSKRNNGITEALLIYGDSSLFERCMVYWEAMRDSKTEFTFAKTHTYSNLHDHQAWFFPDILAEQPENALSILTQLEQGMMETHQPAKIRLVLTGADVCHLDFFQALVRLSLDFEADVRVILKDTAAIPKQVATMVEQLPKGSLRLFPPRDSNHRQEMASRFLLVDGPYVVTEKRELSEANEPAEPRRMCFFFGDDLSLAHQRNNSAIWLRIADKRVFSEAENHWNRLWQMAEETPVTNAQQIKRHSRCENEK